jgi:hypothetical protein
MQDEQEAKAGREADGAAGCHGILLPRVRAGGRGAKRGGSTDGSAKPGLGLSYCPPKGTNKNSFDLFYRWES